LPAQARGREAAEALLGPVAGRAGGERELLLKLRHQQHDANADQEDGGDDAEHTRVEPNREADRRDDQPDNGERQREPGRERQWTRAMLAQR
jgi:hypothetical protein